MSYHIAAADDDQAIRKILQIMLSREGYRIVISENGNQLLEYLARQHESVDCVLLDIKMPGISGLEVLGIITKTYPEIPVIMLTAFSDLDTGMRAIRAGADDYLSKPVRKTDLVNRIEEAVKKSRKRIANKQEELGRAEQQKVLENQLDAAKHEITRTMMDTIRAFSETIEQKDPYTQGHCSRVSRMAVEMGKLLGMNESELAILEGGALLHDIGKIGVPEFLLNKSDKPTEDEREILKHHTESGEKILGFIDMFAPYVPIVRSHHERYDGKGYPDGLSGTQIPIMVRIVTIVDAFDAMTSGRKYRTGLTTEEALQEILRNKGLQFDPQLVDLFIAKKVYEKSRNT